MGGGPLDHEEAVVLVRVRGQLSLALASLVVLVSIAVSLDRGLGLREARPASGGVAPSGAWFCPHGGGRGWQTTVYVANPSKGEATVRLTPIESTGPGKSTTTTIPPGTEVALSGRTDDRAASTLVEYFGPWVAAGWVSQAGGGESGVAAEPCTDASATTWFAPDGTTAQGEDAYLIVMNPYASEARFDVVLYSPGGAPIRDSKLTAVTLKPFRSVSVHVNTFAEDRSPVSAEVDAREGRVAVSSLGVTAAGGVRSVVGFPGSAAHTTTLPGGGDQGQSQLVVLVPGRVQSRFDATTAGLAGPQPAGALTGAVQDPQSARQYPVITDGPAAVSVVAQPGSPGFVAARRDVGPGGDPGATGGVAQSSTAWVVLPTVVGQPSQPGLYLTNSSGVPIEVLLHALPQAGEATPVDVTVMVPAESTMAAPAAYLSIAPDAAILATSASNALVAVGASSSGSSGTTGYAVSVGLPVPTGS